MRFEELSRGVRAGRFKMKWRTKVLRHRIRSYEAVQQYVDVVQKNQFVALAAGVVVHQHTRVFT